jgi:transcription elongation factor GreA
MAYMSEEGYNKLLADLKQLETIERPKIVAAIAEARDKGDLSENAEYDAAKEAQGLLEMKINKLKQVIADAKIIDESKLKTDSVQILNKVELKNVKNGMKMTFWNMEKNVSYCTTTSRRSLRVKPKHNVV